MMQKAVAARMAITQNDRWPNETVVLLAKSLNSSLALIKRRDTFKLGVLQHHF